ncbi:MAG: dCTP deaminase [Thermoplasmatota archaeon]
MPVWSDRDILEAVRAGRFAADPWHEADLTPNGLDLRIGSVLVPSAMTAAQHDGTVTVPPMTRFAVGTQAVLRMPDDVVGSLWIRSSWARRGVLAAFGKVDAGFAGNLTLGAFHSGHEPLAVPIGERFCQIVLEDLKSVPQKAYAARSGNYQNQRGVTLAKA